MRKLTNKIQAVAYHEAGHAVVALAQGVAVQKLTIVASDDSEGHMVPSNPLAGINLDWENSIKSRSRVRSLIRVCMAGLEAQRRKFPHNWKWADAEHDHAGAFDLVLRIAAPNTVDLYMKLLRAETKNILNCHWHQVEVLADTLLDRRTLKKPEVREVFNSAFFPKN